MVVTGVVGAAFSEIVFKLCGLYDERARGFVLGLVAHGVGTARAFEISPVCGAFASLGLSLTGLLTALVLPLVLPLLLS